MEHLLIAPQRELAPGELVLHPLRIGGVLRVLSLLVRDRLSSDLPKIARVRCSLVDVGVGRSNVGKRHTVIGFFGVMSLVVGHAGRSSRSFLLEKSRG